MHGMVALPQAVTDIKVLVGDNYWGQEAATLCDVYDHGNHWNVKQKKANLYVCYA